MASRSMPTPLAASITCTTLPCCTPVSAWMITCASGNSLCSCSKRARRTCSSTTLPSITVEPSLRMATAKSLADARLEVVVEHHRFDGHRDAAGGGDERLGDAARHDGEPASARRRHAAEGVQDSPDGAEEAHERHGGAEGAEDPERSAERLHH